jgi:hypothetical protein
LEAPIVTQLNLRAKQLLDRARRRQGGAIDALEDRIEGESYRESRRAS